MVSFEEKIGGRLCRFREEGNGGPVLLQPLEEERGETLDREAAAIWETAKGVPFSMVAFSLSDWDKELTPWEAPPVAGKIPFGGEAKKTLAFLTEALLPALENRYGKGARFFLGGYSLAGLFSLYAATVSPRFAGIAAVSPSVWYPGWTDYCRTRELLAEKVYLSLGTKEEKTRHPVLSRVGECLREQYEAACNSASVRRKILEWNPGGHFTDPEGRVAKGFLWLMGCRNAGENRQ